MHNGFTLLYRRNSSVQFSSVAQSCLTLWEPIDCSTPGLPLCHQLLEFVQTYVHRVSDATQPSHPLSSPSPPAFNLAQHQVAKVLEFQLQHQCFQWVFRTDFLWDWLIWSPCGPRDSQESSNITVQKHQFFGAQLSLGFPCGSAGKESACNVGDLGSIPGLGRPLSEGEGYPLQYSGLENSMDCVDHGVTKSRTRLRDFHFQPSLWSNSHIHTWLLEKP